MDLRIIYALILSMLPVSELRGGLPLAIIYANEHDIPVVLAFLMAVLANILVIFFVFYFLDNLHHLFLKNKFYKKIFDLHISGMQKRIDKFERRYSAAGFLALTLFVAFPFPATGAWSGVLIAWLLDLERKRSILAISIGVLIAGVLVLLGTLGFLGLFA
jgi:uncharacterized membrane protein